jgi:hypothetical protein
MHNSLWAKQNILKILQAYQQRKLKPELTTVHTFFKLPPGASYRGPDRSVAMHEAA